MQPLHCRFLLVALMLSVLLPCSIAAQTLIARWSLDGNAEATLLKLESFTWTDPSAVATTLHDGELRIADICQSGGYVVWLDVRGLANGSYVCVLKTSTLVVTERLEVRR